MKQILIAGTIALLPIRVAAQDWLPTVFSLNGSTISIDTNSVKRAAKSLNQVAFMVQISGMYGDVTASIGGNCKTGSWRLSSQRRHRAMATIEKSIGDELLNRACSMPYKVFIYRVK